jgi:hypothetical protein
MTEMARGQKVASDSLVWHPGLDAWACVAALSPSWWGASLPQPAVESKTKQKLVISQQPLVTSTEEGKPSAKRRLAAPVAPSEDAEAKQESGGLLKRLFGFGKKKK